MRHKYKYKLKFNLARGKHFRQWQIRGIDNNEVQYFDPNRYNLTLHNCFLSNKVNAARKIYEGESNRQPVAYILFDRFDTDTPNRPDYSSFEPIFYNPKKAPFWRNNKGDNIDKSSYSKILVRGFDCLICANANQSIQLELF